MPLQDEPVAIPVIKGLDLRTAARLVEPPALLEAVNTRLVAGASKRYGHTITPAVGGIYPVSTERPSYAEPSLTPYGAKVLDSAWLFGWGRMTSNLVDSDSAECAVSSYPEAGYIFGGGVRDSQVFAWSGHSLFNYTPDQPFNFRTNQVDAVMPALRVKPVGKPTVKAVAMESCDTGKLRSVFWVNENDPTGMHRSVYDSKTGAPILTDDSFGSGQVFGVRCFTLGDYTHVVWFDDSSNDLSLFSYGPLDLFGTTTSLGSNGENFDVWKIDETKALVCLADGTNIEFYWVSQSGALHPDYPAPATWALGATALDLAVAVHPTTEEIAVVWTQNSAGTYTLRSRVLTPLGVTTANPTVTLDTFTAAEVFGRHFITVAPKYLKSTADTPLFDVYAGFCTNVVVNTPRRLVRHTFDSVSSYSSEVKFGLRVASQAFRAGNRTFVWVAQQSALQSTWYLVNERLDPVGKLNFSVANTGFGEDKNYLQVHSVNWNSASNSAVVKDRLVYHTCLSVRTRVPSEDDQTLFSEPTPQFIEMDFLPELQTVQAGRCAYFAGAQLWCYDGEALTEAGFHTTAEPTGVAS